MPVARNTSDGPMPDSWRSFGGLDAAEREDHLAAPAVLERRSAPLADLYVRPPCRLRRPSDVTVESMAIVRFGCLATGCKNAVGGAHPLASLDVRHRVPDAFAVDLVEVVDARKSDPGTGGDHVVGELAANGPRSRGRAGRPTPRVGDVPNLLSSIAL